MDSDCVSFLTEKEKSGEKKKSDSSQSEPEKEAEPFRAPGDSTIDPGE